MLIHILENTFFGWCSTIVHYGQNFTLSFCPKVLSKLFCHNHYPCMCVMSLGIFISNSNSYQKDCWLWHVPWHGCRLLLQTQRRYDSCQVDSSWGHFVQEVHHKEWCVELWDGDVWDMVTGTQAVWGVQHWRGEQRYIQPKSCGCHVTAVYVPSSSDAGP